MPDVNDLRSKETFQRFIAVFCSYRRANYLNRLLNAVYVAELVLQQQYYAMHNERTAAKVRSHHLLKQVYSLSESEDVVFLN